MAKSFEWQHNDEILLYQTKEHIVSFIIWHIKDFFLILVFFTIITSIFIQLFKESYIIILIISFSILFGIFLYFKNKYNTWIMYVTNKRILKYMKSWIFARHEKIYSIQDIKQVRWDSSTYFDILFKYWTINMDTASSTEWKSVKENKWIYFRWIKNHKDVVLYFSRVIDLISSWKTEELTPYIPKKLRQKNNNK